MESGWWRASARKTCQNVETVEGLPIRWRRELSCKSWDCRENGVDNGGGCRLEEREIWSKKGIEEKDKRSGDTFIEKENEDRAENGGG